MATFNPPTSDRVPPFTREDYGLKYRLLRHYKSRARGSTVLKINGTYATYDYPSQDEIDMATEVYLGGHVYDVDGDTATALTDAGYGDNIT